MDIKLMDLRKLAIEKRAAIIYKDRQSGRMCKVNTKGIVEVLVKGEPISFDVEEVLGHADEFIIETDPKRRIVLTREQMIQMVNQSTQPKAKQQPEG